MKIFKLENNEPTEIELEELPEGEKLDVIFDNNPGEVQFRKTAALWLNNPTSYVIILPAHEKVATFDSLKPLLGDFYKTTLLLESDELVTLYALGE